MKQPENTKFYVFEPDSVSLRPATETELKGDKDIVEVQSAPGGTYHLEIQQYYSSFGTLRLSITQPLDRALKTFAALLVADQALEDEGDK